mgnify:FL=1|tara:strand:+ start:1300 stop:1494 length:195 start_codon:yes stop_codon:yes gene_type:complete
MGKITNKEQGELDQLKIKLFKDASWSVFINNEYPRDVRRYTYLTNKKISSMFILDELSEVTNKD